MKSAGIEDDRFRLAVESSPAAMIMMDREGIIRFANAESERMFGYARDELVGKSIDLLVPANLRQTHASLRRGFLANPSNRPMGAGRDLKWVRRDGSEFPLEIGLTPIHSGAELIVFAIVVDITARRHTENALARRAAELERANERLEQFAYVASHDLQEPLRKIAAFSNIVDDAIANSNQEELARANTVIRTAALYARELVDDLLTLARTINSEQQLKLLDLREAIEFSLSTLSESIIETNAKININLPKLAIHADQSQFVRLMLNILSNAVKYHTPGRGATIDITAAAVDGMSICLAIADDGIGFEGKYAQAIFEPFKRLHSKAEYPGCGIGLAICKAIADRHEWQISVKSAPGEGTTFFLILPAWPKDTLGDSAS